MSERKRGSELKEVIYKATIEILESEGYRAVNFQKVAKHAHTARGVLYRYWDDVETLIYEAGRAYLKKNSEGHNMAINRPFNNGRLRLDLLEMLHFFINNARLLPKNFMAFIFFEDTQGRHLMDDRTNNLVIMERILVRAQERGEVSADIALSAKLVPFELLRQRMMVEGVEQSDEALETLVDEILLPLYLKR